MIVTAAQTQAQVALVHPDGEWARPLSQIAGIRELRDGRILLLDNREQTLLVADLRTGTSVEIGRAGAGPNEFGYPLRLVSLPGDSTLVYDRQNVRLMVVLSDGTIGRSFREPAASPLGVESGLLRAGPTLVADGRGRLYWQGMPYRVGQDRAPIQPLDSVAIERWDRATAKLDTVAFVPVDKSRGSGLAFGNVVLRQPRSTRPAFESHAQWTVTPDGRVAIIYLDPYRAEFVDADGRRSPGPPVMDGRIRVSDGHKEEWREEWRRAASRPGSPSRAAPEPASWPEYLPPFLPGALIVANDGNVWVRRTTASGEPGTYDVFDARGHRIQQVTVRRGSHVVGFGRGAVYVARVTEDGLHYLERFRFPM